MCTEAELLARLRVAIATGHLPQDLGEWILRRLTPSAERRRRRDAAIRAAAARLGGSRWSRAVAVHAQLEQLREDPELAEYVDPHIAEAFILDPASPKTLRAVLKIVDE